MILLGILFLLAGLIGLMLPVVPQIPFFVVGCLCLTVGSERFKHWFTATGFYTRHVAKWIKKHQKLADILEQK